MGGDYHEDNRSWQRNVDNRGGRYAGRDYIERQRAYYEGDQYTVDLGQDLGIGSGRGIGRLIALIGWIVCMAGFAGWAWLIFTFASGISSGGASGPGLFDRELYGLPVAPVAFAAFAVGGIVASIGGSMAKAARRRHEQRERDRRRREHR